MSCGWGKSRRESRDIYMKSGAFFAPNAFFCTTMLSVLLAVSSSASAQRPGDGNWASETDPVAKHLVEQERRWATLACSPGSERVAAGKALVEEFIAADFTGTSPKGVLYSKSDMLSKDASGTIENPERDCKLLSAKVRYFGLNVAVIYGSESAIIEGPDGKEMTRGLVWTDTVLFRAKKWQVIAVQDMVSPTK
jgi:hypothetical protein